MWSFILTFLAYLGFQFTLMITYHEWSGAVNENQRRLPNVMIRALTLMASEAIIYVHLALELVDLIRKSVGRHHAAAAVWYLFIIGIAASGVLNLIFGVVWLAQMKEVLLHLMDLYGAFRRTPSADLEAGGDTPLGDLIPAIYETTSLLEESPAPDPVTLEMDPAFRNPMYAGMPSVADRERLAIAERKRNRPQVSDDGSSSTDSDIGPLYCDANSQGGFSSDESPGWTTEGYSSDGISFLAI